MTQKNLAEFKSSKIKQEIRDKDKVMILSNLDKTKRLNPTVHDFYNDSQKMEIDPLNMLYCDFNLKTTKDRMIKKFWGMRKYSVNDDRRDALAQSQINTKNTSAANSQKSGKLSTSSKIMKAVNKVRM